VETSIRDVSGRPTASWRCWRRKCRAYLDAEQRELLTEGLNSCMRRLGAGLDVVGERDAA
jgi:hypothetical protein